MRYDAEMAVWLRNCLQYDSIAIYITSGQDS